MKAAFILASLALAAASSAFAPNAAAQAVEIVPAPGGGGRIIAPRPLPPPGWVYRWVAPLYRTVTEQVWIPESRRMVAVWVEIVPGRLEQVWREVVTPGHWETRTRQELVSAGHYELVRIDPPIIIDPPRIFVTGPRTVGVEGYASGPGEDLSKFSGLSEWPR
jgi:hypothetical protein